MQDVTGRGGSFGDEPASMAPIRHGENNAASRAESITAQISISCTEGLKVTIESALETGMRHFAGVPAVQKANGTMQSNRDSLFSSSLAAEPRKRGSRESLRTQPIRLVYRSERGRFAVIH